MSASTVRSFVVSSVATAGGRIQGPAYAGFCLRSAVRRWIVFQGPPSSSRHFLSHSHRYSRRRFSSTQADGQQQLSPLSDPEHRSLFYHIFTGESEEPVFALSLDEERPPHLRSRTILGWLPASREGTGLDDFTENGAVTRSPIRIRIAEQLSRAIH